MPALTAADFKLYNASPEYIEKLNLALQYASQNADLMSILKMASDQHVAILFNPPNNTLDAIAQDDKGTTSFGQTASARR
jgi:hypothetical protein